MKRYLVKVMKRGDRVLNVFQDRIAIQRKNGEVDIFRFVTGDDGAPRLDMEGVVTITFGDGTIEVVTPAPARARSRRTTRAPKGAKTVVDDGAVIRGTF